jgi:hypothetical protein
MRAAGIEALHALGFDLVLIGAALIITNTTAPIRQAVTVRPKHGRQDRPWLNSGRRR